MYQAKPICSLYNFIKNSIASMLQSRIQNNIYNLIDIIIHDEIAYKIHNAKRDRNTLQMCTMSPSVTLK